MSKVAIVTGSATGLGAACAIELAARGWNIVVNYSKSRHEAEETLAKVQGHGVEAMLVQANISQDADCRRLAAAAVEKWGRIDGLINNAAVTKFQKTGDLEDVTPEDFAHILGTNVTGTYMMTRAVYPTMKKQWEEDQERGAVVNISSIAGGTGNGSSIPYSASKGAINTMTLGLARWLAPAVRVNTVCPGVVQGRWLRDGMGETEYENMMERMIETTPLRLAGTAEQSAEAAVFLLTSGTAITGEILFVDAGSHLGGLPLKGR
ncbi:MAG: SDR family NAD(P)-dependent oxidoreductase [Lautropia sp.]